MLCCFKRRLGKCGKNCSQLDEQSVVFSNGRDRVNAELDIVSLVNSIRKADILASVLLDDKQQVLCRYQNSVLLDSNRESRRTLSY